MIDDGGQPEPPGEPDLAETLAAAVDKLRQVHVVLAASADGEAAQVSRSTEVLSALIALRRLREQLAGWEPRLIAAAREQGVSWAVLAPALGVTSRQAAERRYLRLQPSDVGATTAEQRVAAERTKRAGERAVAHWARENSASLRQLAGQVSALHDLDAPAQRHADRVGQALAGDDPAALLSPLADAHPHLANDHAALAHRISTVTERAEQLRQETRVHRQQLRSASPESDSAR